MATELILAYNRGASVPFDVVDADWASRDPQTGKTEFFKKGELVRVLMLEPSQYLYVAPVNTPSSN